MRYPKNADIANALNRIADLLEVQGANRFRVAAYRRAANRINDQAQDEAVRILSKEDDFLEKLPDIGQRLAGTIREFVHAGRIGLLDHLEGQIEPERLFMTVPNTARAHELGKTHDWVVIYGYRDGEETQHTVVTEQRGPLAGRRVVRGRESECMQYFYLTP